jgi:hypothetical protein
MYAKIFAAERSTAATRAGVPYQRFIRQALEEAIAPRRAPYRGKKAPTEHLRAERDIR